jgi:hypothetical protein
MYAWAAYSQFANKNLSYFRQTFIVTVTKYQTKAHKIFRTYTNDDIFYNLRARSQRSNNFKKHILGTLWRE